MSSFRLSPTPDLSRERLAAIVESSTDAIVSKDLAGIIQTWNRGAQRLFGYAAEEVIGRSITLLMPPDRENEEPGILARVRRGERIEHYETIRRCKDGSLVEISLTVSPIIDANGQVVGASKIARDITERKRAEEALRESEERFRLLVEGADEYAMFLLDPNGHIIYWSSGAERVFGWTADEALGETGEFLFTAEDRAKGEPEREIERALQDGTAPDSRWLVRKDGSCLWVEGTLHRLDGATPASRGFAKVARDMTRSREEEERLRRSHRELEDRVEARTAEVTEANARLRAEMSERAALEQELLLVSEREKRHIGQDLHDTLCQELAATALLLESIAHKKEKEASADAKLFSEAARVVNNNVGLARDLARGLHALELNATGLADALRELAFRTNQGEITCRFECPKPVRVRDEAVALHLYRIAQEAVTNALKHARPTQIAISLSREAGELTLTIENNGKPLPARRRSKGMGIHIMHYRAKVIGATCTAEARGADGTRVRCSVPPKRPA